MLLAGEGVIRQGHGSATPSTPAQTSAHRHNRSSEALGGTAWFLVPSDPSKAKLWFLPKLRMGIALRDPAPQFTSRLTDLLIEDLVEGQLSPLLQILLHHAADAERQRRRDGLVLAISERWTNSSGVVLVELRWANRAARPPSPSWIPS